MTKIDGDALVLLSGGQDSATCLAWALARFERVETIGFFYGQRHAVEMDRRAPLREGVGAMALGTLGQDHVIDLSVLGTVSRSALTADMAFAPRDDGLPNSFVPGRNLVFLTFAAIVAEQRGLRHVVTGVCETDYSGYPDCRDDTIKALQAALNLGMQSRLVLHTPLMWRDKAQTWALAEQLGGAGLVETIRRESLSCYNGDDVQDQPWGHGCGTCDACRLRARGWEAYQSAR